MLNYNLNFLLFIADIVVYRTLVQKTNILAYIIILNSYNNM